jgi:hypothetical protein
MVAHLRRGAVLTNPARVVKVTRRGAGGKVVVLRAGTRAPRVGGVIVAAGSSPSESLLDRVTSRQRLPGGRIALTTKPATLSDAYKDFSVRAAGTLADASSASARTATFGGAFDCKSDTGIGPTVSVDIDLSKLHWLVELQTLSPYIEVVVTGKAPVTLDIKLHGRVTCTAKKSLPVLIAVPGTPMFIQLRPAFSFQADGSYGGHDVLTLHLTYGFIRSLRSGNADFKQFRTTREWTAEGAVSLEAFLGIDLQLTLAGRLGVGGKIGPVLTGTRKFTPRACTTWSTAFRGELIASADVFFKSWTFALASVTFGRHTFFDGCALVQTPGSGPPGGGGADPPPGGGDPGQPPWLEPHDHVTALTPTNGPAGYAFLVVGAPCDAAADETPKVQADYDAGGSSTSIFSGQPGVSVADWFLFVDTSNAEVGTHVADITCTLSGPAGSRTGWHETLSFSVTEARRPTLLAGNAPQAGGSLVFVSGVTLGQDPCPTIPGLVPAILALTSGFAVEPGGSLLSGRNVDLPTNTSTEAIPLPSWVQPSASAAAFAECWYEFPGHPDFLAASFRYQDTIYQVGGLG